MPRPRVRTHYEFIMRKPSVLLGVCALLCAAVAFAAIDLSDFDDDLMQDMDDAIKDLEPVIAGKSIDAARADAETLQNGLKWTEDYFAAKGSAPDAVKFAQEGQGLTASILKSLAAGYFESSLDNARKLAKTCRTCHDVYKPLTE